MDSDLTLQRATLLLLSASLPIAFLWFNARTILLRCGQDVEIAMAAQVFVAAASPDLLLLSLLHPLRVFLRSQNITLPVTYCSSFCVALHGLLTYLLAVRLRLGIAGVAAAMVWTNLNLLVCLLLFLLLSGTCRDTCPSGGGSFLSGECFHGWPTLLRLAAPSCVSVCLEWWWWAGDRIPAQSHPDSGRDHAGSGQMAGSRAGGGHATRYGNVECQDLPGGE
ncbi:protein DETOXIFICATION 48-like [Zingiber officinale]|uniref:protein DETOXIFICATION 48-like n=1 Tax=Zingiber officinale TaxID=94328 RepID=UPI001C4C6C8D|nr:protein DETOXIFICATION 48-like [Zingiber officinale]